MLCQIENYSMLGNYRTFLQQYPNNTLKMHFKKFATHCTPGGGINLLYSKRVRQSTYLNKT